MNCVAIFHQLGLYVHAMPGRLRVDVPAASQALLDELRATRGIDEIRENPLSGRMLVRFDEAVLGPDDILQKLLPAALSSLPASNRTAHAALKAGVESLLSRLLPDLVFLIALI